MIIFLILLYSKHYQYQELSKNIDHSGKGCINDSIKLLPLIIFVVAITNSTLFSSCCDKNLKADISAYVQPPKKNTNITLEESLCEFSD